MKTKLTRIALTIAALMVVLAVLQPVQAACDSARIITTFETALVRSYLYTPGTCPGGFAGGCAFPYYSSVTGYIQGDFWILTYGDKADTNGGIDNGTFLEDTYSTYYISPYAGWVTASAFFYPAAINSTWAANPGINGCPDNVVNDADKCMAVMISDVTGVGPGGLQDRGYFVYMTDQADALGNYNFGLSGGASINLSPIPVPSITGSAADGTTAVNITVARPYSGSPGTSDGFYIDGACGIGDPIGWKVRAQNVDATGGGGSNPPPTGRDIGDWAQVSGGVNAFSVATDTVNVSCIGDEDVYLAYSICFDSGYEITFVGPNSPRVECGENLADPGDRPNVLQARPDRVRRKPTGGRR
jgi:hypothetical protein